MPKTMLRMLVRRSYVINTQCIGQARYGCVLCRWEIRGCISLWSKVKVESALVSLLFITNIKTLYDCVVYLFCYLISMIPISWRIEVRINNQDYSLQAVIFGETTRSLSCNTNTAWLVCYLCVCHKLRWALIRAICQHALRVCSACVVCAVQARNV